jgi:pyrrolidone-carboxylate peptidase
MQMEKSLNPEKISRDLEIDVIKYNSGLIMKIAQSGLVLFFVLVSLIYARPVVMLTGYWAPTSEMIYRFSNDPILNPDGWIGENWEGKGYDVYAFFPAFDVETREFEVDYQATWEDFWARSTEFHPEIIISFGAAAGPWEIENKAMNCSEWFEDDVEPFYPTPNPPDSTFAADEYRYSSLPNFYIRDAVNEQTSVSAWVDVNGDPGNFLCNYIAYLGMWYQSMHAAEDDEFYCRAAGFIHVNGGLALDAVTLAAEVTLRSTLDYFASIADLEGTIVSIFPGEECLITLNSNEQIYQTNADENGDFQFDDLLFGDYSVIAESGRLAYYQGEFHFGSADDFLSIELVEYPVLETLTYHQDDDILAILDIDSFIFTAAYYPPELLSDFSDCLLNTIIFKAPANSADCSTALFLYRGNPLDGAIEIVGSTSLPDFQQGDLVEAWLTEIYLLQPEDLEAGLSIAFGINSLDNSIAYADGSSANPHGNLIRTGPDWQHADEAYDIQGNWNLQLGFYAEEGTIIVDQLIDDLDFEMSNYPNPFNPTTTISLTVNNLEVSVINIFDIEGRRIKTIPLTNIQLHGRQNLSWNGTDTDNRPVASGVYFYKADHHNYPAKKMILLR